MAGQHPSQTAGGSGFVMEGMSSEAHINANWRHHVPFPSKEKNIRKDRDRLRRKLKAHKIRAGMERLTLGEDLEIDKVQSYAQRALVGRLEFVWITRAAMLVWMREACVPVIGYMPRFTFLLNGWCSFHFLEELDAIIILRAFG